MTEIMKDGERIISIFKTADRSTFLHEMGHVFFDDIQKLASMENAPEQLVLDWNKLKEWSEWDDAQGADNTKAHEKFARGWEAYLREGNAPTRITTCIPDVLKVVNSYLSCGDTTRRIAT